MRPVYAGAPTLLALSDQCVRDLLRALFHVAAETDLLDRMGSDRLAPVSPRAQSKALRAASKQKLESIEVEAATLSREVRNLILNLGNLLSARQSLDSTALDPDRARFQIRFLGSGADSELLHRALQEARFCGLIHYRRDGAVGIVRLHSLLSPHFGIAHRKPMYDLRLTGQQALALTQSKWPKARLLRLLLAPDVPDQIRLPSG